MIKKKSFLEVISENRFIHILLSILLGFLVGAIFLAVMGLYQALIRGGTERARTLLELRVYSSLPGKKPSTENCPSWERIFFFQQRWHMAT